MSNAADTRERLLESAQTLFAREGVYRVPLRRIVEHAGQRNASALHYYFGGRDGLLREIIRRHDKRVRAERRQFLEEIDASGEQPDLRRLVEAFVVPVSSELLTEGGRDYLRIVSQLSMLFDYWDVSLPRGPTETQQMFHAMEEELSEFAPSVRHLRIATLLGLVTDALAARARRLDRELAAAPPLLDHDMFVSNLMDMALGAFSAPSTIVRVDGPASR
jgi:AcrR family transcriptional regulator